MNYELVDPKRLEPSAYNPRKISVKEMESLRRSIREFGLVQPILIQMPGNRIIAGHQRRDAAIAEGLAKVPVHRLRVSDSKARSMNLAMNKISGEWDDDKLVILLRDLETDARQFSGFGEDEISKLLGEALEGREPEEFEPKPAPEIVWILLGIPRAQAEAVQPHVLALEGAAEVTVKKSGIV